MNNYTVDQIEPLGCRVLVKVPKVEEKTAGGIVLIDSVREKDQMMSTEGEIIAYGPTAFLDLIVDRREGLPPKGLKVLFIKYAGTSLTVDDEEYRIINDEDIITGIRSEVK